MIAVIVTTVCFVLMVVFAASTFMLGQMLRAARSDARREIEEERRRGQSVLDDARARHGQEVERLNAAHAVVLEQLAHTIQYGTPQPVPAAVKDADPDAESRLLFGINEDMVHVGAQHIKREYERIGHIVSDEECEAEARAMLHGMTPDIPPERMGVAALQDGPALVKES